MGHEGLIERPEGTYTLIEYQPINSLRLDLPYKRQGGRGERDTHIYLSLTLTTERERE